MTAKLVILCQLKSPKGKYKIVSYSDKISIEKTILRSYKNFKLNIKNKPSENIKKYDRKYLAEKLSKILDYYY